MEKALSPVSSLMLGHVGPRSTDVSHGFNRLVKNIRRSTSTVELDDVIGKELELLRRKLSQPDMRERKTKELLVRLMYCEMLGHSASFGYITALKMTQQGSLQMKRVGYLAASLFLHPNHELLLLLVNTVQKDLKSTNILDNCMALTAISSLFGSDMIPAVLHQVIEKMKDASAMVRKKAVMTTYSFLEKAPHLTHHLTDKFKEALCDREPAVMGAALHIYNKLVTGNPSGHQSLVRPLVSILMQVSSHKLPDNFEFHGVPAPWMQIKILNMLSRLGHNNEYASNLMYDVLEQVMQRVSLKQMVSYAVHYECVSTIAAIYPNKELTSLAAKSVSRFLKSRDNNLRYLGIEALGHLLAVDPGCGSGHQMILVECLTDTDFTLRKKTLELLYLMANSSNVEVICDKFLECLPSLADTVSQQDLSQKVVKMASEHHQSLRWFLKTICELCRLADWDIDGLVPATIDAITQQRKTIGAGISTVAVEAFLPYTTTIVLNEPLVQLTIWVAGEFCSQDISSLMVQDAFQYLLAICHYNDTDWQTETKMFILSALWKVHMKSDGLELNLRRPLEAMLKDREPEVRQRAAELLVLSTSKRMEKGEISSDTESSGCDWTLSFLDQFVSDALADGAAPYRPKQQRITEEAPLHNDVDRQPSSGLNFQPYTAPPLPSNKSSSNRGTNHEEGSSSPTNPGTSIASGGSSEHAPIQQLGEHNGGLQRISTFDCSASQLKLSGVKRVWGKSGYTKLDTQKADEGSRSAPSDLVSPPTYQATTLPYQGTSRSPVATVELNTTTAIGESDITQSMEEEEDPELKQKKDLAQALFGNQISEEIKSPDQSHDVPVLLQQSSLGDLLSMGNDALDGASLDPLKTGMMMSSSNVQQEGPNIDSLLQSTQPFTSLEPQIVSCYEQGNPTTKAGAVVQSTQSLASVETQLVASSSVQREESVTTPDSLLQLNQSSSDRLQPQLVMTSHDSSGESVPAMLDDSYNRVQGGSSMEPSHQLPAEFRGFASSRQFEHLCSDELVQVQLCRVWKPQELGLVFFVNNKGANQDITAVQLTASLPACLRLNNSDDRKYSGTLDRIGSQGSSSLSMCCSCTTPSANMVIGGDITYRDHTKASRRLFFSIDVNLKDLLRPHRLTTPEFGRAWGQPCHDVRLTIDNVTEVLQVKMTCLSENLPVTVVDVSGDEALCATTVLQSSSCLIHFKQENRKLNVWIKTNNRMLCDVIGNAISRTLREAG